MPSLGIFVAERLRHLIMSDAVSATVVAPVPWFPFKGSRFGAYGAWARMPHEESFEGNRVIHPRYPLIPKVGMTAAPLLLASASYRAIRSIFGDLDGFDLIDAHYFYPDGVAAAMLGRWFRKPVVITGRGTDLNLIPRYHLARRQIQWAMRNARGLVTVSEALRGRLIELGASPDKVKTLRNGVDLQKFRPLPRDQIRRDLGIEHPTLLSVGHLIERKGHHIAIESLTHLPEFQLIIVGSGPMQEELKNQAIRMNVVDRIRFVGAVNHSELLRYYNAADCLVLCSSREGMANVLLESIACGTPVAATAIWGTPEVIGSPDAGVLMEDRSAQSLAKAVHRLFESYPGWQRTRRWAEKFDWGATTEGQLSLFEACLADR
ncbi:glycosyltransferase [Lentisalinibacter salinarum]|uniref:glycosyltransferase n=1 Tax=Lentisalinibacter salinarum TaxID=2992239 RepID=UPI00386A33D2